MRGVIRAVWWYIRPCLCFVLFARMWDALYTMEVRREHARGQSRVAARMRRAREGPCPTERRSGTDTTEGERANRDHDQPGCT